MMCTTFTRMWGVNFYLIHHLNKLLLPVTEHELNMCCIRVLSWKLKIVNILYEIFVQVIIEAVRGAGYVSDIAIDDVKIANGSDCLSPEAQAPSPTVVVDQSEWLEQICQYNIWILLVHITVFIFSSELTQCVLQIGMDPQEITNVIRPVCFFYMLINFNTV